MSVLGELQSTIGEDFFVALVHSSVQEIVLGDHASTTATENQNAFTVAVQVKAVDGLGFSGSSRGRSELLNLVAQHPSSVVRIEAIRSYLANVPNGAADLAPVIRPSERITLDRFDHLSETDLTPFDQKMSAFLALHPEQVPASTPTVQ